MVHADFKATCIAIVLQTHANALAIINKIAACCLSGK
jgi:hypothetical protein